MKKHLLHSLFLVSCTLALLGPSQAIHACNVKADFIYKIDKTKVTFTNHSMYGRVYYWDFDNGTADTTFVTKPVIIDYLVSQTTVFKVKLIAIDTQYKDCRDTVIKNITVYPCYIKADFTPSNDSGLVTFTNLSTPGKTYYWDFGNSVSGTGFSFSPKTTYYPAVSTTYTITLVAIDSPFTVDSQFTTCSDTTRKLLTIHPWGCAMTALFDIEEDSSNNFSGIINNLSTYDRPKKVQFRWSFGDGDTSYTANPTHVYPGPGTYELCLLLTDSVCGHMYCNSIRFDSSGAMKRGTKFSIRVVGGPETSIGETTAYQSKLKVFPNPGNGLIHIQNPGAGIKQVTITDVSGKVILSGSFDADSVEIDVSAIYAGIYFMNVEDQSSMHQCIKFTRQE